ncbi:MAG TPA: 2-dehydropantoate 2-reductase [Burkholderiaceae bacterium]|nr:2-dehydropantoate 2-reductase [Burkholderiaceae bacterium]
MKPAPPGAVLVMGAGAVGCYIGGCLAASGVQVTFVGRQRILGALREHGLALTDLDGGARALPAGSLSLASAPPPGSAPSLVLLCVKSGATAEAADELAHALPAGTPVVSLQNGISNTGLARAHAPQLAVLAGMVAFNVVELGPGRYHRATSGALAAQDHPALRAWQPVFAAAGVPLELHADLAPWQWGKLLLNLNNPVNALSGLPLRAQLLQRDYRVCMAALIAEALLALHAAGIAPAKLTPLPPAALPAVLRLPTALFRLLAFRMLRIDEKARSSMADDLAQARPTEVDALCGEVVRLARAHGVAAPVNERIGELVRAWPREPRPRSGAELRAALGT